MHAVCLIFQRGSMSASCRVTDCTAAAQDMGDNGAWTGSVTVRQFVAMQIDITRIIIPVNPPSRSTAQPRRMA